MPGSKDALPLEAGDGRAKRRKVRLLSGLPRRLNPAAVENWPDATMNFKEIIVKYKAVVLIWMEPCSTPWPTWPTR